ncbi:MAG: hypothetical protein KBD78_14280 [Oligoflexales bacterium]|nr:hypothetical protein [Oligoflexales bacterium]
MHYALFLSLLSIACILSSSCKSSRIETAKASTQENSHSQYEIVYERKIADFFKKGFFKNSEYSDSFEASGVEYFNNKIYIIFDDQAQMFEAILDLNNNKKIQDGALVNIPFTENRNQMDIEGIDIHPNSGVVRLIEEFLESEDEDEDEDEGKMFVLWEKRQDNNLFSARKFFYEFKEKTSGMEGIATRSFEGREYIFILCEGKPCKKNTRNDAGTIEIFTENYENSASIELNGELMLSDYSALDIRNDRFALLSQAEGVLLLGKIEGLNQFIVESRFQFSPSYCNLEGVSFIDDLHLVLVSDKANDQHKYCKAKERSIHIVKINSLESQLDRMPH